MAEQATQGQTPPTPPADTAQSTQPQSSGWWGGLWSTVKKKSEAVLHVLEEDLSEFTKTVTEDTKSAIKSASLKAPTEKAAKVGREITAGITSFIDQITSGSSSTHHTLNRQSEENKKSDVILSRKDAAILALQTDEATYCTEVENKEDFGKWLSTFNIQEKTEEISQLLSSNSKVFALHTKLVPTVVSYRNFWERYYYRLDKILQEELKRATLLQRASTLEEQEEDFSWDLDEASTASSTSTTTTNATTTTATTEGASSPASSATSGPLPQPVVTETEPAGPQEQQVATAAASEKPTTRSTARNDDDDIGWGEDEEDELDREIKAKAAELGNAPPAPKGAEGEIGLDGDWEIVAPKKAPSAGGEEEKEGWDAWE